MRRIGVVLGLLLLLGAVSNVLADGDSRPATAAEQEYSLRMLAALAGALPQPWPEWESADGTEVAPFERVTPGCEASPLTVDYTVRWINPSQAEREREAEDEAIARAAARMQSPDMQAGMEAFMAEQEKLLERLRVAMDAQNMAEVERVQKEMEALGARMESMASAQDAVLEGAMSGLANKSRLDIRMAVNPTYVSELESAATDVGPIAGHPAFAYHDAEGTFEDRLTVLVGAWRRHDENDQIVYELTPDPTLPHTRAQSVTVTVTGDPELARRLCAGIDWSALAELR